MTNPMTKSRPVGRKRSCKAAGTATENASAGQKREKNGSSSSSSAHSYSSYATRFFHSSNNSTTYKWHRHFHVMWIALFLVVQMVWLWPSLKNSGAFTSSADPRPQQEHHQQQQQTGQQQHHPLQNEEENMFHQWKQRRREERRQEMEQKLLVHDKNKVDNNKHKSNEIEPAHRLTTAKIAAIKSELSSRREKLGNAVESKGLRAANGPFGKDQKELVGNEQEDEWMNQAVTPLLVRNNPGTEDDEKAGSESASGEDEEDEENDDGLPKDESDKDEEGDGKREEINEDLSVDKDRKNDDEQNQPKGEWDVRNEHDGVDDPQRFDGYFKDPNATIADWEYYPKLPQAVQEPDDVEVSGNDLLNFDFHNMDQCLKFLSIIDDSPPPLPEPSHIACEGYDGILHIRHFDGGGASGTAFFQFTIGMLQWADQHNYLPWIHIDKGTTKPIWDSMVHKQERPLLKVDPQTNRTTIGPRTSPVPFFAQRGMTIGWARDKRDEWNCVFPGKPVLGRQYGDDGRRRRPEKVRNVQLQPTKLFAQGTGVWEHYFMPPVKNGFVPGDKSCIDKPLVKFTDALIAPGIHANAPWAPRAWRTAEAPYIVRNLVPWDDWFAPQRKHAAEIVQRYIRFNPYMERRARCILPNPEFSLGLHIRHGDKHLERDEIKVSTFYRYAKAFVENGGGAIYVATDSVKVFDKIYNKWPSDIVSHIVRQPAVQGLTRNHTAAFDLGVSPHRTNVEALTDLLVLSKCTFLLHGLSALSEAVLYINPGLVNRSINLEDEDHHHMGPKYFVSQMMPLASRSKSVTLKQKERF